MLRVPLFAGHDDRFVGRAYGIDFGTLLHQNIVYDIVIDRYNLYSFFDVQCGTCLYNVFTAQFIGVAGFQGYVFGYCTFQDTAVFYPLPLSLLLSLVLSSLQAVRDSIPAARASE